MKQKHSSSIIAKHIRNTATSEIARVGGYYAVQGHLRSPILPVDRLYVTSDYNTNCQPISHLSKLSPVSWTITRTDWSKDPWNVNFL